MEALNQAAPGGCSSGTLWRTPAAPAQRPMPEQRQSGPGIGSFVVSATCAVLMFLLLVVAGMLELSTPGPQMWPMASMARATLTKPAMLAPTE